MWISRGIYGLLALVLFSDKCELLNEICELICIAWFDVGFK